MDQQIYNFSAGPAIMPVPVLERAQAEIRSLGGSGMSVMEISHRSKLFERVLESAEQGIRRLMSLPPDYNVLFLQGGATLQFSMVPMNLLAAGVSAEYVITGVWGKKAVEDATPIGAVSTVYTSESSGFTSIPGPAEITFDPSSAYVHYTSNETIDGVEFSYDLDAGRIPVVCDASSNILSKPFAVEKYGLIYAGAQKNIGPSGVTVVVIRDDLLARKAGVEIPRMLDYTEIAKNRSMLNTPNTWGIYLIGLVCEWLEEQGGISAMAKRNREKAGLLYTAIDNSDGFYRGHADREARSMMNVTFRLPSEDLDRRFCTEAEEAGLHGLTGHRTAGGIRASIYNAFPKRGVEALIDFMKDFASRNG